MLKKQRLLPNQSLKISKRRILQNPKLLLPAMFKASLPNVLSEIKMLLQLPNRNLDTELSKSTKQIECLLLNQALFVRRIPAALDDLKRRRRRTHLAWCCSPRK